MKSNIPKKYLELVGTTVTMQGGVFSGKQNLPPRDYACLDIRMGTGTIVNVKELREKGSSSYEYPTFQLLLKREGMKRAQWSGQMPIREINLKKKKAKPITPQTP